MFLETPPRTWGKHARAVAVADAYRNTPTDVGKTVAATVPPPGYRKHPHGRGENTATAPRPRPTLETPPRTWGKPF